MNAHYLVKTAYNIIKPVLSEQSREKVVFMDSSFHEQLARDIGAENLYPRWGGTKQPSRGSPEWGTIRPGGVPPPEIRWDFFHIVSLFGHLISEFLLLPGTAPPSTPSTWAMSS